ncbi:MAG: hypothetical protein AAGG51_17500, partial [Cyanobacteria bacterium P01_G01_bin.54]
KMPALRDFLKERTVAQVVAERSRSASRLPPMLRNMNFANSINFANNISGAKPNTANVLKDLPPSNLLHHFSCVTTVGCFSRA